MTSLPGYDSWLEGVYDDRAKSEEMFEKYDYYLGEYWDDASAKMRSMNREVEAFAPEDMYFNVERFADDFLDHPLEFDEWIADLAEDAMIRAAESKYDQMKDEGMLR